MGKSRNHSVDILRMVGAFAVINLHSFSGGGVWLAEEIIDICRFAVPMFFLISGYFAAKFTLKRKVFQILKIFSLAVFSNLLYIVPLFFECNCSWRGLRFALRQLFTQTARRDLLLWNESPLASHLWFLGALLYVLILDLVFSPLFQKLKQQRLVLWGIVIFLFAEGSTLYHILTLTPGEDFHLCYYRSYLFFALPFYLSGKLLRDSSFEKIALPRFAYPVGIVLLCGLTLLERYLTIQRWEVYVGSAALAFLLLHLAITHPLSTCPKPVAALAWLGQHTSLLIYIVHIFVQTRVHNLYFSFFLPQYELSLFHLLPIGILIVSTILAVILHGCAVLFRKLIFRRKKAAQ